jgi:hypothetical protein
MAPIGLKRFRLILFLLSGLGVLALLGTGYWLKGRHWLDDWRVAQQLGHAVNRVEAVQTPLREFIERTGFWPNSPLDARLDDTLLQGDEIIDDIRFGQSSLLTVTFRSPSEPLQGHTLIFIPEKTASGTVRWRCDEGSLAAELRPARCRSNDAVVRQSMPASPQLPSIPTPVREAVNKQLDPLTQRAATVRSVLEDKIDSSKDIRLKVNQFLLETGQLPMRNQQINLPEPHQLADRHFRRVGLDNSGAIVYEFGDGIAGMEGHKFMLVPTGFPGVWRCQSALPEDHVPALCSKQIL